VVCRYEDPSVEQGTVIRAPGAGVCFRLDGRIAARKVKSISSRRVQGITLERLTDSWLMLKIIGHAD